MTWQPWNFTDICQIKLHIAEKSSKKPHKSDYAADFSFNLTVIDRFFQKDVNEKLCRVHFLGFCIDGNETPNHI